MHIPSNSGPNHIFLPPPPCNPLPLGFPINQRVSSVVTPHLPPPILGGQPLPPPTAESFLVQASESLKRGEWTQAKNFAYHAFTTLPTQLHTREALCRTCAHACANLGEWELARVMASISIETFSLYPSAVQSLPHSMSALSDSCYIKTFACSMRGEFDEIQRVADISLSSPFTKPVAQAALWSMKAQAFLKLQRWGDAKHSIDVSITLCQTYPQFLQELYLNKVFAHFKLEEWEEVKKATTDGLSLSGVTPSSRELFLVHNILACMNTQQWDETEQVLNKALQEFPESGPLKTLFDKAQNSKREVEPPPQHKGKKRKGGDRLLPPDPKRPKHSNNS